jgi:hypothetical protein
MTSSDRLADYRFWFHGDLADHLVVGRVHQINEQVSVGREKLALDLGAINGWQRPPHGPQCENTKVASCEPWIRRL